MTQLIRRIRYDGLTADPTPLGDGEIWYRSDLNRRRVRLAGVTESSANLSDLIQHEEADRLIQIVNSDWAVTAGAGLTVDTDDPGMSILWFDQTTEEGIGLKRFVPPNTTDMVVAPLSKAKTAPAAARNVGFKVYTKVFPNNLTPEAWDTGTALNDIAIPMNVFTQYDTQTIPLSTIGISTGQLVMFEFTRVAPTAGTNLEGDWGLLLLGVGFV